MPTINQWRCDKRMSQTKSLHYSRINILLPVYCLMDNHCQLRKRISWIRYVRTYTYLTQYVTSQFVTLHVSCHLRSWRQGPLKKTASTSQQTWNNDQRPSVETDCRITNVFSNPSTFEICPSPQSIRLHSIRIHRSRLTLFRRVRKVSKSHY